VQAANAFTHDVVIVGGGLAGASLAVALAPTGLRIAVVEAMPWQVDAHPSYDDRTVALALGSQRILAAMAVWPRLAGGVCPIEAIHVSDAGHAGVAHLDAAQMQVEALGYVVEVRALGAALYAALTTAPNIALYCPAALTALTQDGEGVSATVRDALGTQTLRAPLAVGADGGRSQVRAFIGVQTHNKPYSQVAIVSTVTPAVPHGNIAYERFTADGPLAFLPMTDHRCAVVWSTPSTQVDARLRLPDAEFLAQLERGLAGRLGALTRLGRRAHYPLARLQVQESTRGRTVLIGNAAHTVHPVAGQGFNLGLRDVAILAEMLADTARAGGDVGAPELLTRYAARRRRDHVAVGAFTDGLIRLFSNRFGPLVFARNIGLLAVEASPWAKRALMRRTMGLSGDLPRLARGLGL